MSKPNSIRSAVNTKFIEMLPQLATIGGKAFRRQILDWSVEKLEITMSAAATHYNYAFHRIKEGEPELVVGLGRPEGKNNGGRKKKTAAAPVLAPAAPLLLTYTPAQHDLSVLLELPATPLPMNTVAELWNFTVVRCKDGAVVGTGLSEQEAEEMVAKAVAAKKAKLEIK